MQAFKKYAFFIRHQTLLPYYSPESGKLADTLKRFIEKSYPQLQIQFSLSNPLTIASFFHTEDNPALSCSLV